MIACPSCRKKLAEELVVGIIYFNCPRCRKTVKFWRKKDGEVQSKIDSPRISLVV